MQRQQLISPGELAQKLDSVDWHIIDCRFHLADAARGRREYAAAHIPGAVFMDLNKDLASVPSSTSGRHPLPEIETIASRIGQLGISNASNVVVYDSDSGAMAARCWWIFRWLGHDRVRLLDGGLTAWVGAHLPLTAETRSAEPTTFVAKPRYNWVISSDELEAELAMADPPTLIDARDAARFAGDNEPIDPIAGHIPGARNLPYTESLQVDGRWNSGVALESLWREHLGDDTTAAWIAMCGSGVTACHLALSAVTAGYAEPRLYVGSWSEWIRDAGRPRATGTS